MPNGSFGRTFRILELLGGKLQFRSNFKGTLCKRNSTDPDQMPGSMASDLVLHCLLMSHKMDGMLIWVNISFLSLQVL